MTTTCAECGCTPAPARYGVCECDCHPHEHIEFGECEACAARPERAAEAARQAREPAFCPHGTPRVAWTGGSNPSPYQPTCTQCALDEQVMDRIGPALAEGEQRVEVDAADAGVTITVVPALNISGVCAASTGGYNGHPRCGGITCECACHDDAPEQSVQPADPESGEQSDELMPRGSEQ